MDMDPSYSQKTFIEVYDLEIPDSPDGVVRREDVTTATDAGRNELGLHFAKRVDRSAYGVRLATVTINTLQVF